MSRIRWGLLATVLLLALAEGSAAQLTTIGYQGELKVDGVPYEGDADFITVEGVDEHVTVAKRGSDLRIEVREEDEDDETVDIQIPLSVVEALLEAEGDELDIVAALRELGRQEGTTLVTVKDDEDRVRIWVDSSAEGI